MDPLDEEVCRHAQEIAKEYGFAGDVSVQISPLTKTGDNYIAVVSAVEASGKDASGNSKTLPMVVKMMHKDDSMNESLQINNTFANEINLYTDIAPAFREFQKKFSQTKEDLLSFIPKCYKTKSGGVSDLIFLEDLRVPGFTMRDRKIGLSFEDCMMVMKSLGAFHAFSYAMKEKDPKTFKRFSDRLVASPFFNPKHRERYSELFQKIAVSVMDGVRLQSPATAKNLVPFISGGYFDVVTNHVLMKDDYSVIAHGDTWTNNILFRGDPPSDVRFVDYQVIIYTTPTADVMYTLNTSISKELREAHFEDFLQGYHSALTSTLRQLGANPETLPRNVFNDQIRKYALCSLGYGIFVAPVVFGGEYEEEKDFSNDDGMVKIIFRHNCCMKDPEIQKFTAYIVNDYVKRGFI